MPGNFADWMDAAFALNRFQNDGADGVVEFRFQVANVIEFYEFDAGHEGREGKAVFLGRSGAYRAKCAAVKRIRHRQNAMLLCRSVWRFVGGAPVKPREL